MDNKKQKLLLEYLVSSPDTFALCASIVESSYFDPEYQKAVSFIQSYYDKFHTTPTPTQAAPDLIAAGDYESVYATIRDAITISLNRNLGLRYFDDPEARLKRLLDNDPVEPTGWTDVDELLYGGIGRKELLLVSANSGGGKSITLANLGYNFVQRGLNVLYISFELDEDTIAQRYDTMYTGISRRDWQSNVSLITTRLEGLPDTHGKLDIVQMPTGTNANQIRAYLKEFFLKYDMYPDLLIVDYLDKMYPNETRIDHSDVWTKDKLCSEQVRQIAVDYNMFCATASQLNRDAVKAKEHDHSHIAGGISKINESDIYWSIMMTPSMQAAGEIAFMMQKTRNSDGAGNTVFLKWDKKRLRIVDLEDENGPLKFKRKVREDEEKFQEPSGDGLLGLMKGV
jgi:KaiC/GvpD/RAD55 family RecA-like ATPase